MRIANYVSDSIVDGPGLRLAVFTQGCPHACPGCHNPETHDPKGGRDCSLEELVPLLRQNPLLEGLTLSGGEPFEQAGACAELARAAHAAGRNVWVYSGYRYEALCAAGRADWQDLLQACDVLVDGPFFEAQREYALRFRGSRNQRVIDLKRTRAAGHLCLWNEAAEVAELAHFRVPES